MNKPYFSLLIGNEGSFSEFIHNFLLQDGFPIISIILKKDANLDEINNLIDATLKSNKISTIIYIGGEVRNKKRMAFANYIVPKHIALFCLMYDAKFIYLSSLAALGNSYKGRILLRSSSNKIKPLSEYGKTKQDFDDWVEKIPKIYSFTTAIYPASILGRSHNNSSLQKMVNLFYKVPFLRYLNFKTIITFCDRSEIALAITNAMHASHGHKILVSHNLRLSTLRSLLYPRLPSFNLPSFIPILDAFSFLLPRKFRVFLISSLSEAIFTDGTSNDFLSSEQLKEICIKYKIKIS